MYSNNTSGSWTPAQSRALGILGQSTDPHSDFFLEIPGSNMKSTATFYHLWVWHSLATGLWVHHYSHIWKCHRFYSILFSLEKDFNFFFWCLLFAELSLLCFISRIFSTLFKRHNSVSRHTKWRLNYLCSFKSSCLFKLVFFDVIGVHRNFPSVADLSNFALRYFRLENVLKFHRNM
jgi:hypothetical protein